jgi:hypothetical protein
MVPTNQEYAKQSRISYTDKTYPCHDSVESTSTTTSECERVGQVETERVRATRERTKFADHQVPQGIAKQRQCGISVQLHLVEGVLNLG